MDEYLLEKLKQVPVNPGVYLMKNEEKNIIYVGKAKNLKNRLSQYFNSTKKTYKTTIMVSHIFDFEYFIVNNELEALMLENNLIKLYMPQYNILLKDDKTYPYVRINLKEDYPTIRLSRGIKNDGAKYFGPYMQDLNIRDVMEICYEVYNIRENKKNLNKLPKNHRPCINFAMGRCKAPCIKNIDKTSYNEIVEEVMNFLNGNTKKAKEFYEEKISKLIENEKFEEAIKLREKLEILKVLKRKSAVELTDFTDKDIFCIVSKDDERVINVLFVRNGFVTLEKNYYVQDINPTDQETLSEFIVQFYLNNRSIPKDIITNIELEDRKNIETYLTGKILSKANISTPKKGTKKDLIKIGEKNALDYLENLKTL